MSVGTMATEAEAGANRAGGDSTVVLAPQKSVRFDRCFSGLDIKLGKGPLKDMDSDKLKRDIRKWAKAVVAYARQLSFKSPKTPKTPSNQRNAETENGELANDQEAK